MEVSSDITNVGVVSGAGFVTDSAGFEASGVEVDWVVVVEDLLSLTVADDDDGDVTLVAAAVVVDGCEVVVGVKLVLSRGISALDISFCDSLVISGVALELVPNSVLGVATSGTNWAELDSIVVVETGGSLGNKVVDEDSVVVVDDASSCCLDESLVTAEDCEVGLELIDAKSGCAFVISLVVVELEFVLKVLSSVEVVVVIGASVEEKLILVVAGVSGSETLVDLVAVSGADSTSFLASFTIEPSDEPIAVAGGVVDGGDDSVTDVVGVVPSSELDRASSTRDVVLELLVWVSSLRVVCVASVTGVSLNSGAVVDE